MKCIRTNCNNESKEIVCPKCMERHWVKFEGIKKTT